LEIPLYFLTPLGAIVGFALGFITWRFVAKLFYSPAPLGK